MLLMAPRPQWCVSPLEVTSNSVRCCVHMSLAEEDVEQL